MDLDKAQNKQKAIEETLAARHRLDPDSFFYDKLRARMEREAETQSIPFQVNWIRSIAFASFLMISCTLSIQVILNQPSNEELADQTNLYDQIASDYFLEDSSDEDNWYY